MKPAFAAAALLAATATTAQSPQPASKSAEIFNAHQLRQEFAKAIDQANATGLGGVVLADYGSHNLRISTRAADGGAEVHAHFADVFYVTEGHATLITGGTVVDPVDHGNGETLGKSIRNGTSRETGPGDLINIPPGTPHQLLIPRGTTFSYVVVKVRG